MKNKFYQIVCGCLFIAILVAGCSFQPPVPPTPTIDSAATEQAQALQQTQVALDEASKALAATQTRAAMPTETPVATNTPEATSTPLPTSTPTGPVIISDDFSSDAGRFKCDECEIAGGSLVMGPYPAMDSINAYYAICADCPVVANYKMSVDATFVDGASDRGFGLVLRENDGSFIDLEILTWQYYGVWTFDAKKGNTWSAWDTVSGGFIPGNLKAGKITNHIEVTMTTTAKGANLAISFNGKRGRVFEIPGGKGKVGLLVGMHSLGVSFDNFYFEELVP